MLRLIPLVAEEADFALFGGSAINYFAGPMHRYSVDVDLRHMPIEGSEQLRAQVLAALARIQGRIERADPTATCTLLPRQGKLVVESAHARTHIDANPVQCGALPGVRPLPLAQDVATALEVPPCEMQVVSEGELYGGKINAALTRQNPRDTFDVKKLLAEKSITAEMKTGLFLYMAGSRGDPHLCLNPRYHNRQREIEFEFAGMTAEAFSHEDHIATLQKLVQAIHALLTDQDREFLLSLATLAPKWELYDFSRYPAVQRRQAQMQQWKLASPHGYQEMVRQTESVLQGGPLHTPEPHYP